MTAVLGCIADDFTGGTDLAETLSRNGMRTIQLLGVPDTALASEAAAQADALVVALKIRTVPVEEAVSQALAALEALRAAGCRQFFWKYCSTFDSTPKGNIGPVAEALLQALGGDRAVVCPSFPENKRTVYQGYLFVGDRLLHETSMRSHPLTPMTDANLIRLMDAQSSRKSGLVPLETVREGVEAVKARMDELAAQGTPWLVCDALSDAESAGHRRGLRRARAGHGRQRRGPRARRQLRHRRGRPRAPGPRQRAGPRARARRKLFAGDAGAGGAVHAAAPRLCPRIRWPLPKITAGMSPRPSPSPAGIARKGRASSTPRPPRTGSPPRRPVSAGKPPEPSIERALADIAAALVETGVRRILVAGGETSGAVVSRLGVRALRIGETIAPGVPWTETLLDPANPGAPHLALALKSGNFGGEDFFMQALGLLANAN